MIKNVNIVTIRLLKQAESPLTFTVICGYSGCASVKLVSVGDQDTGSILSSPTLPSQLHIPSKCYSSLKARRYFFRNYFAASDRGPYPSDINNKSVYFFFFSRQQFGLVMS